MANKSVITIIFSILFGMGCHTITTYKDLSELDGENISIINANETCYLNKASKQASFILSCEKQKIESKPLTKKMSYTGVTPQNFSLLYRQTVVKDFPVIETIGSSGCGRKIVFNVICSDKQIYFSPDSPNKCSCDVMQGSTSVEKNQKQ